MKFGGRINGIAKWKAPNPKINNASKRVTFKAFNALASLTFFNTNNLKDYLEEIQRPVSEEK